MRPSTKFSTAVHICIYLNHTQEDIVSSSSIADSVKTNPVVIRRLIHDLRVNGIIASTSGSKGGFYLNKPASELSLWDIYLATREEELFKRPKPNPDCVVSSNLKMLVHDSFIEAENSMKTVLSKVTIADMENNLINILGMDTAPEAIIKGK
ncbi:MAG TPA: Rrf2 family transcriptional regulator [Fulvivirga sp.]|nr:Rrf2 family transcriptional regulator [Fulvivirga sp.]